MRTFDELNADEQTKAVQHALDDLLGAVVEGAIRFNDDANGDDLQTAIDRGIEKANANQTPWFAGECILEETYTGIGGTETVREGLEGMARCDAEAAMYPDPDERIIRL